MTARDRQVGGRHYLDMAIAPWDVIDTWPAEQQLGFYRGTALAYVMRAGLKGEAAEDVAKAIHTLTHLHEQMTNGPEQRGHAEPGLTPSQRNWPDA